MAEKADAGVESRIYGWCDECNVMVPVNIIIPVKGAVVYEYTHVCQGDGGIMVRKEGE